MFNIKDSNKNAYMLDGSFAEKGYDWWWHSFTAINHETGEEKQFFIEYFLCNPKLGGDKPVFGHPGKPSYLMIKAGSWGKNKKQLHRFLGWNSVKIKSGVPFYLEAKDCVATDTLLKGSVEVSEDAANNHPEYMCDAGSMKWELTINKDIAFNVGYGAGTLFRKLKAFEMYWHAQGMKSLYSGKITFDGTVYDVIPEKSYGYADKNWGRGFTTPWVWLSSNCLRSNITGKVLNNSVFDIGGGKPKVFFVPLDRKLLGGFYYEGKEFEYNFSKFWMKPATKFSFKEDAEYVYWRVWQENYNSLMKVDVKCRKEDMLFVNYVAPDGTKRHNHLWNGGNGVGRIRLYYKTSKGLKLIDDIQATHIGCEYGEYDKGDC